MKRVLAVLLAAIMFCVAFSSCGGTESDDDKTVKIICTSHVVADWVENIIPDDGYEVIFIGKKGSDMHNYQPTASDIKTMSKGDLIVYIGGESDRWVADVDLGTKSPEFLKLIEVVDGLKCEVEHSDAHEHEDASDEHIWLSFENAVSCTSAILEALQNIDGERAEALSENLELYQEKINALFEEYKAVVRDAKHDTLVFADRFPFIYLMHELNIKYYAAFSGCSAETGADFKTVIELAEKIDELSLPCVLVIEDSADGIARAVVNNTSDKNLPVLSVDSMQVYGGEEFDYLKTMADNLEVLKIALGTK